MRCSGCRTGISAGAKLITTHKNIHVRGKNPERPTATTTAFELRLTFNTARTTRPLTCRPACPTSSRSQPHYYRTSSLDPDRDGSVYKRQFRFSATTPGQSFPWVSRAGRRCKAPRIDSRPAPPNGATCISRRLFRLTNQTPGQSPEERRDRLNATGQPVAVACRLLPTPAHATRNFRGLPVSDADTGLQSRSTCLRRAMQRHGGGDHGCSAVRTRAL